MRMLAMTLSALLLAGLSIGSLSAQSPQDGFKTAYAKAEAQNKKAGEYKNQWTTTAKTLKAAQKAAESGDYELATRLAARAEALADASIAQSEREEKNWRELEIR